MIEQNWKDEEKEATMKLKVSIFIDFFAAATFVE